MALLRAVVEITFVGNGRLTPIVLSPSTTPITKARIEDPFRQQILYRRDLRGGRRPGRVPPALSDRTARHRHRPRPRPSAPGGSRAPRRGPTAPATPCPAAASPTPSAGAVVAIVAEVEIDWPHRQGVGTQIHRRT